MVSLRCFHNGWSNKTKITLTRAFHIYAFLVSWRLDETFIMETFIMETEKAIPHKWCFLSRISMTFVMELLSLCHGTKLLSLFIMGPLSWNQAPFSIYHGTQHLLPLLVSLWYSIIEMPPHTSLYIPVQKMSNLILL